MFPRPVYSEKNAPTGAFFVKIYAARETPAAAVGKYILKQIKKLCRAT
jgi:hypothetical protein